MDHTKPPEKPICEHQEFHGTFLQNNICVFPDIIEFKKEGELLNFLFSKKGLYNENIQFSVHHKSNLQDTLFFETIGIINIGVKANILFSYSEGSAIVGEWEIPKNKGTKNDYLIIDEYNSDTTIIKGRFQCKFQTKIINQFVNAPDTLNISCGSFKLKRE